MKSKAYCLLLMFVVLASVVVPPATSAGMPRTVYVSAAAVQEITGFDRRIPRFMERWQIPGGSVAVAKDGRLVFAKGYGVGDKQSQQPVQPDTLFRVASISKPITCAAILRLIEEGKLSFDDKPFLLLNHLQPPLGATVDKRIYDITIRQLLQHTGGWDLITSFDPMFISNIAAQALGASAPASSETVIRYMLAQPLQFTPGTAFSYSNFGYNILGRVIEKVSGQSYETYVKENLFNPAGVTCMRVGRSLPKDRAENEVRYYDAPGAPPIASVFPEVPGPVPAPDGGWHHESLDATGGWVGSAIDVVRFVTAIDGFSTDTDILRPATLNTMVTRPDPPLSGTGQTYYAMGWGVAVLSGGLDWQHTGGLNGTSGFVIRMRNGVVIAALFNSWGRLQHDALLNDLGGILYQSVNEVQEWPAHNLFADFAGCDNKRADFNLAITPTAKVIAPGESTEIVVDAVGFNNFSQSVNLSATVAPADDNITLSFSSANLEPGGRQTLMVRALNNAPTGEYKVTLTGAASERSHSAIAKITIAFGPQIQSAIFDGKKSLSIEGVQFGNNARVIINDTDRSVWIQSNSPTEIKLKGKAKKMGLRAGDNTVQVIDNTGKTSNVVTVSF